MRLIPRQDRDDEKTSFRIDTPAPFSGHWRVRGPATSELKRLDWSEIDLDRGYITVAASKAKTRQRRLIPTADNLKPWLMPSRKASGPVCPHVNCQHAAKAKCEGFTWAKNGLRSSLPDTGHLLPAYFCDRFAFVSFPQDADFSSVCIFCLSSF